MRRRSSSAREKGLMKWLAPKRDYKKLVSFLLSTRMHMILCSRAKQPILEAVVNGEKTLLTQPWEPIQDKRLKYEMTIVVPMTLDGAYETDPTRLKAPGDLLQRLPLRHLGEVAREHRHGEHERGVLRADRALAQVVADPGRRHPP